MIFDLCKCILNTKSDRKLEIATNRKQKAGNTGTEPETVEFC